MRPFTPYMAYVLRFYVHNGGSLFMTHLGWSETSCALPVHIEGRPYTELHDDLPDELFPEVTAWAVPSQGNEGNHVLDQRLFVTTGHPIVGSLTSGAQFAGSSPDHMILSLGPHGQQIVHNVYGDPVVVVGGFGKGKVVYSGSFYGYTSPYHSSYVPAGDEREVFYSTLDWLTEPPDWVIVEGFDVDPTASGNGWQAINRTGNISVDTGAGTCTIDSIGDGSVSPQFYLASGAKLTVEWANAEMIVTADQSEPAGDVKSAFGSAVWVANSTRQYVLGVRVQSLGGGVYQTTVAAFDENSSAPNLIGSYVLTDTGVNEHRYNAELDMTTGVLSVYVDGHVGDTPVITGPAGASSSIGLAFGDLRAGAFDGGVVPNGNATFSQVSFNSASLLPLAPVRAQEYCGDDGTVFSQMDVTGPYGMPDCYVNIIDFGVLSQMWMQCTDPANPGCL